MHTHYDCMKMLVVDHNTILSSIKKFQKFNRLTVTGELDDDTFALMTKARCGDKDVYYREFYLNTDAIRWSSKAICEKITGLV